MLREFSSIEGLTGYEPIGKALRELVVANELEYLLLARQVEQRATKHQFSGFVVDAEERRVAARPRLRSKILVTGNRPPF